MIVAVGSIGVSVGGPGVAVTTMTTAVGGTSVAVIGVSVLIIVGVTTDVLIDGGVGVGGRRTSSLSDIIGANFTNNTPSTTNTNIMPNRLHHLGFSVTSKGYKSVLGYCLDSEYW
jgi:hypothetical protein